MNEISQLPQQALSVRQPWAWAIMFAGKDIENRSRAAVQNGMKTGRICIHASLGMTQDEYESAREQILQACGLECPPPHQLVRGAIIGAVDVVAIVSVHSSKWFYGTTSNDRGLVLRDPQPCDALPCKGELGYFAWHVADGEIAHPLPWMIKWPGKQAPAAAVVDAPLSVNEDLFK